MSENLIKSPCIGMCGLDENKICRGCFRTNDEITQWYAMDNEQRQNVIKQAEKRRRETEEKEFDL